MIRSVMWHIHMTKIIDIDMLNVDREALATIARFIVEKVDSNVYHIVDLSKTDKHRYISVEVVPDQSADTFKNEQQSYIG